MGLDGADCRERLNAHAQDGQTDGRQTRYSLIVGQKWTVAASHAAPVSPLSMPRALY